jgi:hypothetical protein
VQKIFEMFTHDKGAAPYTLGIVSTGNNWNWTLAREHGLRWMTDMYSLRSHGQEMARFFWIGNQLVVGYGSNDGGIRIKKDAVLLPNKPLLSEAIPSGSFILLNEKEVVEIRTQDVIAFEDNRHPALPNVQLGQNWSITGASSEQPGTLADRRLLVTEIGQFADPPGSANITLGAKVRVKNGGEHTFPLDVFASYFTQQKTA